MPPESAIGWRGFFARNRGLIFPILIVSAVLVIIAPLPPLLMDLLLATNITVAVVILLTTIYVQRPLEFSVFPTLLLATTLMRLVLNVASTRLILSNGSTDQTAAAGEVIQAFGQFVTGDKIAIGLILFVILIAIQFLVITKGATRISEVAARFALDGMPGKQMGVDADLNAGLITQEEANVRRGEITQQADFYGAMDGASKFVRGDAIAGILITLINIVGGLYIGMVEYQMPLAQAAEVFTKLTIGDGLVTQIPAFLISLAAALIVTRSSTASNLSRDVVGQLFRYHEALFLAAVFLIALSLTGLPTGPMLGLSLGCAIVGFSLRRSRKLADAARQRDEEHQEVKQPISRPEDKLLVDPLELELGVGLIALVDPKTGGDLLERVNQVRNRIAQELGFILPKVRIRDNIRLDQHRYQIKMRDVPIDSGEAYVDGLLAIDSGATNGTIGGLDSIDPGTGRPAKWIETGQRERAQLIGFHIAEPTTVVSMHLTEIVREHASELLNRQQVHQLLENLKQTSPHVVNDLIPDVLKTAQVHQVLKNLLRERVPIRDLETILQTLGDYAERTQDLMILTEYVRTSLARTICQHYRDNNRVLRVITLDPVVEDVLKAGFDFGDNQLIVKLSPQVTEAITQAIGVELDKLTTMGLQPIVLCSTPVVRAGLKQTTAASLTKVAFVALNEITIDTQVESVGQITVDCLREAVVAAI